MDNLPDQCELCPRACGASRASGETGYCGEASRVRVARAALHMWEEPCISGASGSGTVFFSGCNLKCVFCQNHGISASGAGKAVSVERLSGIFMELQDKGAGNINLVTPSHFAPQIRAAVEMSRKAGLRVPIVYNTSCYENTGTLKRLEGTVDIYLPDFKYMDPKISGRYSGAPDYFAAASAALKEMVRQQPFPVFDGGGLMEKGVIVRHLALPGCTEDSKNVIKYLYETYGDSIYISIMNQYTPMPHVSCPELQRRLTDAEYDELVDFAIGIGVENGFVQEGGTAEESFIPEFDNEGV